MHAALRSLQRLLNSQSPDDARLSLELVGTGARRAGPGRVAARGTPPAYGHAAHVIETGRRTGALRRELRTSDAVAALMAAADGLVVQRACAPFERTIGNPLNEAERLISSWQSGRSQKPISAR